MSEKNFFIANGVVSVSCLSLLIWLIYFYQGEASQAKVSLLPAINAMLNSMASVCLIMGYLGIKRGKISFHKTMMVTAFIFSSLFLLCYLYYHQTHGHTPFPGRGWIRPLYFFILISHIILSAVTFPLILTTFYFALSRRIERHKKLAKYTLPLWLYVSVTGILIFFFLKLSS